MYFVLEGKIEFHCENQVETVDAGKTIFLPKGKAHAFYIRSEYLRTLIISLATTEEPVALDSFFASMAKRATSMDIPTDAVTYGGAVCRPRFRVSQSPSRRNHLRRG